MQIDTMLWRLERNPNTTDYTDLITSGAVRTGDATGWDDSTVNVVTIPFSPEPTAAEQDRIRIRLVTVDAAEESNYLAAQDARVGNTTYVDTTSAQVQTQTQAIRDDTNITTTDLQNYVKQLAQGVQVLNNQVTPLTRQNNAIILMLLRLMNRV